MPNVDGAKTVLCFGDSNTWGYVPVTGERLRWDARWTGVFAQRLGIGYRVIEEGLNGRTTVFDDPLMLYRNGREYLIPCLETHRPLDWVVIMLGTNDLKLRFSAPASDIAKGMRMLAEIVLGSGAGRNGGGPKLCLVSPPPVAKLTLLAEMFSGAEAKSLKLARYYHEVAADLGCYFFDAGSVAASSDLDGIHLEATEHRKLGDALAEFLIEQDV